MERWRSPDRNISTSCELMLRHALATYILLLSLTGPNPCCCTLARFADLMTSCLVTCDSRGEPCAVCCQGQFGGAATNSEDQSQPACCLPGSEGPAKRCHCEKTLCNAAPSQNSRLNNEQSRSVPDALTLALAAPPVSQAGEFSTAEMFAGGTDALRSGREIRIENQSWLC